MDGSAHGTLRDANGRFIPGQSGNPAGKRPGTRNRATVLREALRDGEEAATARIVIDKALSGNQVAARFVVDRLMPRPRGRTIELDLPADADMLAGYDATVQAMVSGEITPDEALTMTRVLDGRRRALRERNLAPAAPRTEPSPACGRGQGEGLGTPAGRDRHGLSTQPSPQPSPACGRGSLPRRERGRAPPFHAHLLHSTCILQSPGLAAELRI